MTEGTDRPYVDALSLSDVDTYLYETIATLEYTGRPATRAEIAAAADLDDETLDKTLAELTGRGLLVRADASREPAFEPADRGWSAAPEQARRVR
jgi:hypothetical protein